MNLDLRTLLTKLFNRPGKLLAGLKLKGPSAKGWAHALRTLGRDLEALEKSTEGEFLSIGERIQDFCRHAEEISKMSSTVATLMSGEELGTVIEEFRKVADMMKGIEGQSRRNTENLGYVLEKLSHLNDHVNGFHKTIRRLQVLCVSTRIESARMADRDTGFETLADEVAKLSVDIKNRCAGLLTSSESLSRLVKDTISKALELETTQRDQARIVLDNTMSSLAALMEQHVLSSTAAGKISIRYEAISQRIGKIVMSIQFHDITRQQIEHARQALSGLCPYEGPAGNAGQEDCAGAEVREKSAGRRGFLCGRARRGMRARPGLVADACDLQIAQLNYAGDQLISAVNNILDDLSALADLIAEMTRETSLLAGAADETGHSFLTGVEAGLSSAASALKTYSQADRELHLATGSVGEMLREMSAHAGSIESIGEKIKLLALNAIIKAYRIGGEGATLGVLAEAIHQLSVETCQRKEFTSEALHSIIAASESLCATAGADGGQPASVGGGLRSRLHTLQEINQNIVCLLTRINREGCGLSGNIQKTVDGVHVHRRVEQVIGNVVSGLKEIAAFSRSRAPAGEQTGGVDRLKALEAAYTMQGEREIHRSLLQTEPAEKPCETPVTATGTGGEKTGCEMNAVDERDLGDNVELF